MRHIPALALLSMSLLYAGQSQALTGLSAGVGVWKQDPSGDFRDDQDSNYADVEDDFNIDSDDDLFYWVKFEHFIPVLPNLKLQHTPVSLEGDGTVTQEFEFDGETYDDDSDVSSQLDLDQTAVTLFYSPLNNWLELDVGVNIKLLDGMVAVEDDQGNQESVSFSGPIPMLYGNVQFNLPVTGAYVGAEGSGVSYDGHSLVDLSARVGYRFDLGLGGVAVEGGYRSQRLELDDFDGVDADLRIEGPWLGVAADF